MSALFTDEQRFLLLANGRELHLNPDFDPAPVVKLFTPDAGRRTPDAGATWLLTEIDPDDHDHAFGPRGPARSACQGAGQWGGLAVPFTVSRRSRRQGLRAGGAGVLAAGFAP